MRRKRRSHPSVFKVKVKVALATVQGNRTLAELHQPDQPDADVTKLGRRITPTANPTYARYGASSASTVGRISEA